jgi:hypothetical protein
MGRQARHDYARFGAGGRACVHGGGDAARREPANLHTVVGPVPALPGQRGCSARLDREPRIGCALAVGGVRLDRCGDAARGHSDRLDPPVASVPALPGEHRVAGAVDRGLGVGRRLTGSRQVVDAAERCRCEIDAPLDAVVRAVPVGPGEGDVTGLVDRDLRGLGAAVVREALPGAKRSILCERPSDDPVDAEVVPLPDEGGVADPVDPDVGVAGSLPVGTCLVTPRTRRAAARLAGSGRRRPRRA